jgi:hypothetical protein
MNELHCPYCLSGHIQGHEQSVVVVRADKDCQTTADLKWCANCKQYFVVNVKFQS